MCYSNIAGTFCVILLVIHLELSDNVELQYSSELKNQPNSEAKLLSSTGLRHKRTYEQNYRPISWHKCQPTSEQHQFRSAKND